MAPSGGKAENAGGAGRGAAMAHLNLVMIHPSATGTRDSPALINPANELIVGGGV
jgi:hypothetical protein